MDRPLISIVVPVYNVEKYLAGCVESILGQRYANLEVLLIDDGSTDKSPQVCDAYALKDPRVRVVHQANAGLSAARNAGIERAAGGLIGFIDSDDTISADMFDRLYTALVTSDADISLCGIRYVSEDGKPVQDDAIPSLSAGAVSGKEAISRWLSSEDSWLWVVACNKLYRRALFDGVRYPVGKLHEDEFVIHHLLLQCRKVAYIPQAMYFYLQRSQGITRSAFSIRRLDGAEAQFERADTLLSQGIGPQAAYYACSSGLMVMAKGYAELDLSNKNYQARYGELLHQFRRVAAKLMKTDLPWVLKARLRLNMFSPYVAWKLLERPLRRAGLRSTPG